MNDDTRPRRKTVTAADVARVTNVSRATVSYVLNNTPGHTIPESTRQRIHSAAERLGYVPSPTAQTLASGRSKIVLLIVGSESLAASPQFAVLIQTISSGLADHGLAAIVHIGTEATDVVRTISAIAPALVVPMTGLEPATARALERSREDVPWYLLERASGLIAEPGRLQVAHLATMGHRVLAFAAPSEPFLKDATASRLAGISAECTRHGLPLPVVAEVPPNAAEAAVILDGWQQLPQPPTAVCAYNDEVAHRILAGMLALNMTAPNDLAVIGVDDAGFGKTTNPALTTVGLAGSQSGRVFATALWRHYMGLPMDDEWQPSSVFQIVLRQSA